MNKKILITGLLTLTVLLSSGIAEGYNFTNIYKFSSSSPLASGRWVKVDTDGRAGVYEIGYNELRAMGFSNPEQVAVYGEGGKRRSMSFVINGETLQSDNLTSVPVYRSGNKLYFYGLGTQNLKFSNGAFAYNAQNIYTSKGHYFLTDSQPVNEMEILTPSQGITSTATLILNGRGYAIHDVDKMQGAYSAGQEYWECYMDPMMSWSLTPSHITSGTMSVDFGVIIDTGCGGTIIPKLDTTSKSESASRTTDGRYIFSINDVAVPSSKTVNLSINRNSAYGDLIFDYWVLNYPKDISSAGAALEQEIIGIPAKNAGAGYVKSENGYVAFDITDPQKPTGIVCADNKIIIPSLSWDRTLAVFNPAKSMYRVSNPRVIENHNLHAYSNNVPELVIITVPEYLKQAEEIGEMHRNLLGQRVVVTTTEQLYNEFTNGNPDINSIRLFVSMLYRADKRLKNVLLIGPIESDCRNIGNYKIPENFIIGAQEGTVIISRVPGLVLDVYGMTTDQVLDGSVYTTPMQVGVGALTVANQYEADLAVTKIRSYIEALQDPKMAYLLNETYAVSCTGDNHTHDDQAKDLNTRITQHVEAVGAGKIVNSTLMQDFYKEPYNTQKFVETMNKGKLFTTWIGHAGQTGLSDFITTGNFMNLQNEVPSFMVFAGCDLTYPDHGESGLGEIAVTRAPRGLIGSVASTRTAWSNKNYELAYRMIRSLFYSSTTAISLRTSTTTIGEAYAMAKNQMGHFNESTFIYVGDPALPVPVPLQEVTMELSSDRTEYRAGDVLVINGVVQQANKSRDPNYNGTVVFKIAAPETVRSMPGYSPSYSMTFGDNILMTAEAEVKEGRYSVRIPLPQSVEQYRLSGTETAALQIFTSAYNPEEFKGGAGYMTIPLAGLYSPTQSGSADEVDNTAPVTSMTYDYGSETLLISVTDDTGVLRGITNDGSIRLFVDGTSITTPDADNGTTTAYNTELCVSNFSLGQHTAELFATDIAGNAAKSVKLNFTVTGQQTKIDFKATETAVSHFDFEVETDNYSDLELIVYDVHNNLVYNAPFNNRSISWDCPEQSNGVYRAAVRHKNGHGVCTAWKHITVID